MTHTHHAGMGRCAQCEARTSRTPTILAASGGRWRVTSDLCHECFAILDEAGLLVADGLSREKAHAIVRVHNSVPDLLDEIKRLTAQVERVRELHDDGVWECANPEHINLSVGCPECREVCMSCGCDCPCPTIQALEEDA